MAPKKRGGRVKGRGGRKIERHPTQKITGGAMLIQISETGKDEKGSKKKASAAAAQKLRELAYKRFHSLDEHPEWILTPAELKLAAFLESRGAGMSKSDIQLQKDEAYWTETFDMVRRTRPDLLADIESFAKTGTMVKREEGEDDAGKAAQVFPQPRAPPPFQETARYIHTYPTRASAAASAFLF